jgi:hypothetical protein
MAQNLRSPIRSRAAVVLVQVGAADPIVGYLYLDIVRARLRSRKILNAKIFRPVQHRC